MTTAILNIRTLALAVCCSYHSLLVWASHSPAASADGPGCISGSHYKHKKSSHYTCLKVTFYDCYIHIPLPWFLLWMKQNFLRQYIACGQQEQKYSNTWSYIPYVYSSFRLCTFVIGLNKTSIRTMLYFPGSYVLSLQFLNYTCKLEINWPVAVT